MTNVEASKWRLESVDVALATAESTGHRTNVVVPGDNATTDGLMPANGEELRTTIMDPRQLRTTTTTVITTTITTTTLIIIIITPRAAVPRAEAPRVGRAGRTTTEDPSSRMISRRTSCR